MKRATRRVFRVRAVWRDRTWVVRSPDLDALLVHAHRFDEVAPVARNAIAHLEGVHSATIDIAVQPVSLAEPELQWVVEQALVSQEHAKSMAEQAAQRTLAAADTLYASGMHSDDDIRPLVGDVLAHCDAACGAVFGSEARTAARRLLAHIARLSPGVFRRRGSAAGAAGAICWMIGTANRLFDAGGPRHKDLSAALGLTNAGSRSATFLKAGGFAESWSNRVLLGSPAYLVAEHRRRIVEMRDRYSATAEDPVTRQDP